MTNTNPQRVTELRALIADFLKKRLDDKLDKIKDTDETAIEARKREKARFEKETWLKNAAHRARQIQLVTHVLKATHPDLKIDVATSIYVKPKTLVSIAEVGSHVLGDDFVDDATGNAAALDIYDFLTQRYSDATILDLARASDTDLSNALSEDQELASSWMTAFSVVVESPCVKLTSHTLAKQLYWLTGDDSHDVANFHLLTPLYASSLTHRVYQMVQNDRFGEEAAAAREAKKKGEYSERPVREYPQLAIQKLGGTKPQNISQLNSERRGENLLFASLPPTWRAVDLKPLLGTNSMFPRYSRRPEVKQLVKALLAFLKSDPVNNRETKERRTELINGLIDGFLQLTAELRSLPPGWSQAQECRLTNAEKHWLDPEGVEQALVLEGLPLSTDTAERVSALFANWLNAQLREPLPMGDPEYLEWRNQMHEQIKAEEREAQS
ncbi:MAG: type I-F CRISPR-associated protein Csy1 [Pseudomonadota bacterium]|nr:type I-F CRISPR-associated protein Csy1 [Pseudomonadota bacterium]